MNILLNIPLKSDNSLENATDNPLENATDSPAVEVLAAPTGFLELDIPEDFAKTKTT